MNISSKACKKNKNKSMADFDSVACRRSHEPWACLLSQKCLSDSEGSFTDWHLSSCLQVVLCALLTSFPYNCPAGWWGKAGTIKLNEYESPFPHGWLAGPKLDLMNDYCVLFPPLQSAARRINALARGCQRNEEKNEGSGWDICLTKT